MNDVGDRLHPDYLRCVLEVEKASENENGNDKEKASENENENDKENANGGGGCIRSVVPMVEGEIQVSGVAGLSMNSTGGWGVVTVVRDMVQSSRRVNTQTMDVHAADLLGKLDVWCWSRNLR